MTPAEYLAQQGGFPQNPAANLLTPKNAALLQLASGLLAQSGPQKEPTSFGQGLGLAMPQAMQAYQGARGQEQARQLQQIQMAGGLQQFGAGQAAAKAAADRKGRIDQLRQTNPAYLNLPDAVIIATEQAKLKAQYDPTFVGQDDVGIYRYDTGEVEALPGVDRPAIRGKSVPAEMMNALMRIGPRIENGTATDEEKRLYSLAHRQLTLPKTVGTPETGFYQTDAPPIPDRFPPPPPRGARSTGTDPNEAVNELKAATTTTPTTTPATPPTRPAVTKISAPTRIRPLAGEVAGKAALIVQGRKDIRRFRDMLIKNGEIDRELLALMDPGVGIAVPGTDGELAYSLIYNVVAAKLRIETGAAAPHSEVVELAKRFVPKWYNNDKTIHSKITRLDEFLQAAQRFIDPNADFGEIEKLIGEVKQRDSESPRQEVSESPSQEDLEFTAQKNGITVEEVKRLLGIE
jgi:hypothetical protein